MLNESTYGLGILNYRCIFGVVLSSINLILTYRCDACQIVTTDQGGLDMHFQGKKHKKKLNALKWAST